MRETFARMAVLVDEQNAREPGYQPMSKDLENSPSFQAALELVFAGRQEPNGYTERALTHWRQQAKAGAGTRRRTAPAPPCSTTTRRARRAEAVAGTGRCWSCAPSPTTTPTSPLLVAAVQREYVQRYGDEDATPGRPGGVRAAARVLHGRLRGAATPVACGGGGRATATAGDLGEPAARRGRRGQAHVRAGGAPRARVTRGPCSPSWSAPRPPRAGGARCWRRALASPRPIALYTSAGLRADGAVRGLPALAEQPVLREDPAAVRVNLEISSGAISL